MGITAQFCELLHLREICLEIREEAPGGDSVAWYCTRSQRGGQSLDTGLKQFPESKVGELGGARFRKSWREILRADQAVARGNQVLEKTPELVQILLPRAIGQGRMLLIEAADPTEQMRIATQVRKIAHVGKIGLKVGQEAIGGHSIMSIGTLERLNLSGKGLLEVRGRLWLRAWSHRSWGTDK